MHGLYSHEFLARCVLRNGIGAGARPCRKWQITPGDFSSSGGRVLQKPDLAAAGGVRTSTPGFADFHGTSAAGGLVGSISPTDGGEVTASYWDSGTSSLSAGEPGQGQGRSTAALQGPTDYTGIYGAWQVDLDGDLRRESPWDFGTGTQYPALALDVDATGGPRGRSSATSCGQDRS